MVARHTGLYKNKVAVLLVFIAISFILFAPSTGRIFLSDDYCTLYNIVVNDSVLLASFFRPVGDLTLKWTYKLAGLDPFYFYVVNILLHALNSYLIYVFCRILFANNRRVHLFSIVAGLIFLTYPSHSEAILWAIGRGVSLAAFFSLLAMITFVSRLNIYARYVLVCLFYFIALACYESALLLPFVLFTLSRTDSKKKHFTWSLLLLATLFFHIYLRFVFTGGVWQSYNKVIFARDIIQYLSAFIKIILRLFIPPFDNPLLFTFCGVAALVAVILVLYRNRNRFETNILFARTFLICVVGLLVTILVSISFGTSTRTSEGDRLMYLPSVFYAMIVALLISEFFISVRAVAVAVAVMIIYQITFLIFNEMNWNRASKNAEKIITSIKEHNERPLYIVNLPSDYNGAYVFRNCLDKALLLHNIDTTGVHVVNVTQSTELEKRSGAIVPEKQADDIFIWPNTLLQLKNGNVININNDSTMNMSVPLSSFFYWNKEQLEPVMK